MHELAITQSIVDTVIAKLPGTRIAAVQLEIGGLSGVVADSVRFCFSLVAEGTDLEGATLDITEPHARCRCETCGAQFEPDGPIPMCACGSAAITVLSGQDLKITSVKVA